MAQNLDIYEIQILLFYIYGDKTLEDMCIMK